MFPSLTTSAIPASSTAALALLFAVIRKPAFNSFNILVAGNNHEKLRAQGRGLGQQGLVPRVEMVEGSATENAAPRPIKAH